MWLPVAWHTQQRPGSRSPARRRDGAPPRRRPTATGRPGGDGKRARAPGRPREHVLSRSVCTRAFAVAASCLILSTALGRPDAVEVARPVAVGPDGYAGARSAFLGPLGLVDGVGLVRSPASAVFSRLVPGRERVAGRSHVRVPRVASRSATRRLVVHRRFVGAAVRHAPARLRSTRSRSRGVPRAVGRRMPAGSGLAAVAAWASRHAHGRYVHGGSGVGGYDCSGFTMAAYRAAGVALPHSSGAQAARTVAISLGEARPGDLVIGAGHVGIFAGRGMMWDAGNRRVGVSYRPMYGGLRIGRVRRG